MTDYKNKSGQEVLLEKMEEDIKRLESKMEYGFSDVKSVINSSYVRKEEFEPIKKIVYGMVGLFLTGIVTALLALIIRQ